MVHKRFSKTINRSRKTHRKTRYNLLKDSFYTEILDKNFSNLLPIQDIKRKD